MHPNPHIPPGQSASIINEVQQHSHQTSLYPFPHLRSFLEVDLCCAVQRIHVGSVSDSGQQNRTNQTGGQTAEQQTPCTDLRSTAKLEILTINKLRMDKKFQKSSTFPYLAQGLVAALPVSLIQGGGHLVHILPSPCS